MKTFITVVLAAAMFVALPVRAALNVLACEPEWAALTAELAGPDARITSATTALQDAHHVQARPSLIAAARRADLVVCSGAELEVGWLPVLLRESGNGKVQPGAPGYFEAASAVTLVDAPARLDRSQGDVHAQGNPHIQTDPRNIARVAAALAERLQQVDPGNAGTYRDRARAFGERWRAAIGRWEASASKLRGLRVIEHHKAFTYLFRWLGIDSVATLEPKPGIDPSAAQLAALLEQQRRNPAKLIVRTSYNDPRASEWLAEKAGIKAVMLPFSVGGSEAAKDLYSWFDDMLDRLLKAAA